MSRRTQIILALLVAGLGVLLLVGVVFGGSGSVREHIAATYDRVDGDDPALEGALVYASTDPPSRVARDIADAWSPADRHADPSGYFLRYRDDIVVVSSTDTGSRIVVDEERRGYTRWYPFIGGYWGTYTGRGDDIRGGGPGAGK